MFLNACIAPPDACSAHLPSVPFHLHGKAFENLFLGMMKGAPELMLSNTDKAQQLKTEGTFCRRVV